MNRKTQNYVMVLLCALSMVFLIHIGSIVGKKLKVDITQENLYTLSSGTKAILGKLNRPLKMQLYYSKTAANKGTEGIRAFNNYFNYVRELLSEYVSHSRNNISLEVIDPRPDTEAEEDALSYGLKKFHLTETETYFFGLVIKSESGSDKIIEFFDPNNQEKLEYDITKLIYSVNNPSKKKVGVISSLPMVKDELGPYMAQMMRMQGKPVEESWAMIKYLREFFEVQNIMPPLDEISGIDILVIVHPKNLDQKTLFAIDQYVLKGGKLFLAVDPFAVSDAQAQSMMGMGGGAGPSSNLSVLMDKWGVSLKEGAFAGDRYLTGVGRTNANGPSGRLLPVMQCDERCSEDYKDTITHGLGNITLVYPGVLEIKDSKNLVTPILATTEKGNSYQAQGYELNNPAALWERFKEGNDRVILGVKIIGSFESAFPDGIKVEAKINDKKKTKQPMETLTGLKKSVKESAIVVFSDVDFLADQFAFRQTIFGLNAVNNNATLFLNSLESLGGSKDLMAVRSKGRFSRSFDVIDQIEFESDQKTANKVAQINGSISKFTQELNQLGRQANKENIALIQNEGLKRKKELGQKIALLKRELREVKRHGREKVEGIGTELKYINTLLVPLFLLFFGFFYRYRKAKKNVVYKNSKNLTSNEEIHV